MCTETDRKLVDEVTSLCLLSKNLYVDVGACGFALDDTLPKPHQPPHSPQVKMDQVYVPPRLQLPTCPGALSPIDPTNHSTALRKTD